VAKRSDFTRRAADAYFTWDPRAVRALLPHLAPGTQFAEPCAGEGHLVAQLTDAGHVCTHMSDLATGTDALSLGPLGLVITNPPWSRPILHAMIEHWLPGGCWLLFDADWIHTKQSAPYMPFLTDIVSVGRLRWIEGSTMDGKDNCAWFRFGLDGGGVTRFHGRAVA
jgi:hypothetical protein